VRAADTNETLMKVVKTNVTQQLPIGCEIVGLEVDAELIDAYDVPARLVGRIETVGREKTGVIGKGRPTSSGEGVKRAREEAGTSETPRDVAFVIGAMSHGNINPSYITQTFSLSRYPLSAACTVGKLMNAYEKAWGVL